MDNIYKCFRGSLTLPEFYSLNKEFNLDRVFRIRNRKFNPKTIHHSKLLEKVLQNEKKVERCIRSKSKLDSLFELCPMSPWRATTQLWEQPAKDKVLIYLDFKNFYPSILCSTKFPHPKDLETTKCSNIPKEPGLLRVILHPKNFTGKEIKYNQYKEIHPFQLQVGEKSCPFYIDSPIETLIHTNETDIYNKFFEIQPLEAIISQTIINHPLRNRVTKLIEELNTLQLEDSDDARNKVQELKITINAATTTPKIAQNKNYPSPCGVHCLSSQIISNGRALLFDAIHRLLQVDGTKVLQINTDGFLLSTENIDTLNKITTHALIGKNPGQLRIKALGNQALLLGPNTWWLLNNNQIVVEAGTGRSKEEIANCNLRQSSSMPMPMPITIPIPLETTYTDKYNQPHKINLLHLSDFRHELNHNTNTNTNAGTRTKFRIPPHLKQNPLTPFITTEKEKKRSWLKTEQTFKNFRDSLNS